MLLMVMGGAMFTHYSLEDSIQTAVPSLVATVLLLVRYVLIKSTKRPKLKRKKDKSSPKSKLNGNKKAAANGEKKNGSFVDENTNTNDERKIQ
jgi:hypothetical protein